MKEEHPQNHPTHKAVIYIIMVLLIACLAFAKQPQASEATSGLQIAYPKFNTYDIGTDVDLHFHVFDSNGTLQNGSDTNCSIRVYNQTAQVVKDVLSYSNGDFEYTLSNASLINHEGWITYIVWCNQSAQGGEAGFISLEFEMIDGKVKPVHSLVILLGLALVSFLLLYFTTTLDSKEHFILKILITFFVLYITFIMSSGMLALAASTNLENTTFYFYRLITWFLRLIATYVLVYGSYKGLQLLGETIKKKKERD